MNYSIKYYKERDTDPMVFLQRFRCTTEPIGGGTEYDEEGELVSWDAAVAAIEIAIKRLGWHPASELPPVDDAGDSEWLVVVLTNNEVLFASYNSRHVGWYREDGSKIYDVIKYWCYPPKED